MPFALHNRALFKGGGKGRKGAEKKAGKGVASKEGKKEKRTRENRIVISGRKLGSLRKGVFSLEDSL